MKKYRENLKVETHEKEMDNSPEDVLSLVNETTGESTPVNIKKHGVMVGKEAFYLTYAHLINALKQDMSLSEIKTFAYLLEHYGAGTLFSINKGIKENICKETGLKNVNTVGNVLLALQKKEVPVLYKKDRGTYILNPRYAFKGSSKNRDKELAAIIQLGCKNC